MVVGGEPVLVQRKVVFLLFSKTMSASCRNEGGVVESTDRVGTEWGSENFGSKIFRMWDWVGDVVRCGTM